MTNLREYHWTIIGRGPGNTVCLMCTHRGCGLLDVFLNHADAVEAARDHIADVKLEIKNAIDRVAAGTFKDA